MWVVYRKSDNRVVGTSVDAGVARSKTEALNDVVSGLAERVDPGELDAVEVKDSEKLPRLLRAVSEGKARVSLSGGKMAVEDDTPEDTTVQITTNAQQFHPIDNLPLIPGDGTSFLVVTLQKASHEQGAASGRLAATASTRPGITAVNRAEDNEEIWLRTTNGTLREDKDVGAAEIRSVTLVRGVARFRLYSERAKRVATVEMLSSNPNLRLGGLRVEFI